MLNILVYDDVIDVRVLVGAPTAQTPQPGVSRGGSVFRCDTSNPANDNCQAIPFDVTGNVNLHLFHSAISSGH